MELDETRGVLTTHGWLKMNWTDSKLKWSNASYGGISEIRVQADEVSINSYAGDDTNIDNNDSLLGLDA